MSKKKQAKWDSDPDSSKRVKTVENPQSFFDQRPIWSFAKCDFEHDKWSMPCHKDCLSDLMKRLKDFEGMTWREIFSDTSGRKNNTKNHPIPIVDIIKPAQRRLKEINLDDFEELYSLTITGRQRLWGVIVNGVYCVVWLDLDHEIFPSSKRGT